jgi:glycosyltransferase involved in cell wall biosynthesis
VIVKVLILHQHFKTPATGGAIRSYYLAKALVDKGIETVVITAHNEAGHKSAIVDGIRVECAPVSYDNRFGFTQRVISFTRFVGQAAKIARRHSDADVCYAISTPLTTGMAAMLIRWNHRMPYIFEVGDLWPDAPVQMGFITNVLVKRSLYWLEKWIYRDATCIVALSEPIRDAIVRKVSGKTVHVIPNMADTDFYYPQEKKAGLEEKFGVTGKFVVSYIGALGVANGLRYLLNCAAVSQREQLSVHFIICGDGAMLDDLKAYAATLELSNITLVSFQDREGVREVLNVTDADFICYQPVKILETGSPNKYFDGLAAGKLTVVNFGGWVREEIEREQCGVYVDPQDPRSFTNVIKPFLDNPALLGQYQDAGRKLAEKKYSRRKLGDMFVEILLTSSG